MAKTFVRSNPSVARELMSELEETARFMRKSADELRRLSSFSTFLAPSLLKLAMGLEDQAVQIEAMSQEL
jgi:hypothetical protein